MAIIRANEAAKMSIKELDEKIKDLRAEFIKSHVATKKVGKSNPREIRKTIARLITFKKMQEVKTKKEEPKAKSTAKTEAKKI